MKQKNNKKQYNWRYRTGLPIIAVAVLLLAGFVTPSVADADRFDEQIRELQAANEDKKSSLDRLAMEATSFQDVIYRLNIQIGQLQQQIDANQAEQIKLQGQIEEAQAELDRQRKVLGEDIKTMYVDGEPTTIEMLATSRNLSDFVDKEEYRTAVQKKIQDTLKKVAILQAEMKEKKIAVENLLQEQQAQRRELNANRAEQNRLLTYNKAQQDGFNSQIKENNKKVDELRRKQVEENCRIFGCGGGITGGGGYPWGYAKCVHTGQVEGSCYNYDWGVNGNIWNYQTGGWGYRNCTDWVAYRSGGRVPSASSINYHASLQNGRDPSGNGTGANAKWWDDAGRHMGKAVDNLPSAGDTAVSNTGEYGHVLYVEEVHADGSISLSDYNRAGTGKYDTSTFNKVSDGSYSSPNGRVYSLTFVSW